MSICLRLTVLALLACVTMACGDSPTAPTTPVLPPVAPPVTSDTTLGVLVMGHISNRPIAGVVARLDTLSGATVSRTDARRTGSDGRVAWDVIPDQQYAMYVRDGLIGRFTATANQGAVQWLVSLPE